MWFFGCTINRYNYNILVFGCVCVCLSLWLIFHTHSHTLMKFLVIVCPYMSLYIQYPIVLSAKTISYSEPNSLNIHPLPFWYYRIEIFHQYSWNYQNHRLKTNEYNADLICNCYFLSESQSGVHCLRKQD